MHFCRQAAVTQILFDPGVKDTLWVSVEIDAVHRSQDGGASWKRLDAGTRFRRHSRPRCGAQWEFNGIRHNQQGSAPQ